MLEKVVQLSQMSDSFRALQEIHSQGEPLEVAGHHSQLVRDLYGRQKDVPLMVMIGRAGVQYCLSEAERRERDDVELANRLRGMAKTIAYNVSVNCWPAWEDEGISITASDLRAGFDLAKLNLRLAMELKRPADKVAHAYWLLGAHQLAAGEAQEAIESFRAATAHYQEAGQPDGEQMAAGYAGIAKLTMMESADAGRQQLTAAVEALRRIDTDDARFYAQQLESVAKYFARP